MTIFVGNTAVPNAAIVEAAAKPRASRKNYGWLPVLTVLFLVSYGLMTMLIVEQGSTIESQRNLIRDLFRDSMELSAVKGKAIRDKSSPDGHGQAPAAKDQTPSTQAKPQHAEKGKKPQAALPSRPASDVADERRAVVAI